MGNARLMAGVSYTIVESGVRDQAVRLGISPNEVASAWCALQTSYATDLGYRCVPNTVYACDMVAQRCVPDPVVAKASYSLAQVDLCGTYLACSCAQNGCTALDGKLTVLSLTIDGDVATGAAPDDMPNASLRLVHQH